MTSYKQVWMNIDIHTALKKRANKEGLSMQETLRRVLDESE